MKISFGSKIIEGPYGGGNNFLKNLKQFFEQNGHRVVTDLKDSDIDIILLTNPLIDSETSTFNNYDVDFYIKFKNPDALVFQRINECDERKGTNNINSKIDKFNKKVDVNIFVSDWLRDVYKEYELSHKQYLIIKGGPDEKIFNTSNKEFWDHSSKLKLVTHHWSNNPMKGYAVYKLIDSLLATEDKLKDVEFSFIGNLPKDLSLDNTNVLQPLEGAALANELKNNHIYITASLNEPSGNHHMEGALCGLPILYIQSGALPEYCEEYGIVFDENNLLDSLDTLISEYDDFVKKLKVYPFNFTHAAIQYEDGFKDALLNKEILISKREQSAKIYVLFNFIRSKIELNLYKIKSFILKKIEKLKKNLLRVSVWKKID